ncbi:MAG: Uma2 family endonuclease [Coriobacteriales bacterium]
MNLFADDSTIVEPDLFVVCDRGKLTDRGCEGAPGLVAEIVSPASRQTDYGTKPNLYREAGVSEYWIVDPSMGRTTAYRLDVDPAPAFYPFATPVPCGVLEGLQVDFAAIVADA